MLFTYNIMIIYITYIIHYLDKNVWNDCYVIECMRISVEKYLSCAKNLYI